MVLISFFKITLLLLEITSCTAGFAKMHKLKNSFWKWLPFYLLVIVLGELVGYYLAFSPNLCKYNLTLFNYILNPLQIIFFSWFLYKNVSLYNKLKARWILVGMASYVICWIVDCLFIPDTTLWVSTFSVSIGMLIILLSILLFFYFYVKSEDVFFFKQDSIFWICLGLFLYYVVALPFDGLRNTLLKQPDLFMLCWYINMGLACIMYILFIISFLWTKPK